MKRKFKTYKYFIKDSTIDTTFKKEAGDILRNSSIHAEYNLRETDDQYNADIMLELVERKNLLKYQNKVEYYPGTSKIIRYSLTWQQNMKNRQCLITVMKAWKFFHTSTKSTLSKTDFIIFSMVKNL